MFSVATMPSFSFDESSSESTTATTSSPWSWQQEHRPVVSSPLSSSPLRATSPLSPMKDSSMNAMNRQTQSSPLQPNNTFNKFSRYASCQASPSAARMRRQMTNARENRRKNFLQQVRQRADERTSERRDMEGTLLKSSWDRDMRQRALEKQMEGDAFFSEADIEDAAELLLQQERGQNGPNPSASAANGEMSKVEEDEMMVDEMARQEEDELDAMLMAYDQSSRVMPAETPAAQSFTATAGKEIARPRSPALSDDEDYDALFMELVTQEDMDMS